MCIFVSVTESLPEFENSETEIGSLFLTCDLLDSSKKLDIQINLGSIRLTFNELNSQFMVFNPSHQGNYIFSFDCLVSIIILDLLLDLTLLHRNVFAIVSVLNTKETIVLSSNLPIASMTWTKAFQQLGINHIAPLQCYYGKGIYHHVIMAILSETLNQLEIGIHTKSTLDMKWIIHSLRTALGDGVTVTPSSSKNVKEYPFQSQIASVIKLLDGADFEEGAAVNSNDNDPVVSSNIDKIRKEFAMKQLKLLSSNGPKELIIPYVTYKQWQQHFYK